MDKAGFTRASHAVWESMAGGWDQRHAYVEERARPVAERMLERVAPGPGQTILDLAAGTGVVGLAAARAVIPGGKVIVSDFSSGMLEAAERHAAAAGIENVEFRVLDAERLDLPDDVVDAVVCRWGYMLMADPGAALVETRRVLRPGGRLSCAVFAGAQQNPWAAVPSSVLDERGHMPPAESGSPGILALADPNRLRTLFAAAGFTEPQIEEVPFSWTFDDMEDYWAFLNDAAGALAAVIAPLDEDERAVVRSQIGERLGPFRGARGIDLPAVSLVASAS